ncbi:MAG: ZPR1 zinc finger domain-containing protein [Sulfolobales archaeon]|nr:ZPR1 zinc finger domain-containing protein [Sulfolobales archaeon]MDW8010158.1 ZPR1 zinc finger domain-containing protein [Sulfolobales archaeon]
MSDFGGSGPNFPKVVYSDVIKCPQCGELSLNVVARLVDIKYFGKVIIESGRCSSCGFVYGDVYVAEYGEPKKIEVKVTRESGDYLVIKSSTATVVIPELGVEISPGPAAQGYITTARGILENVAEVLSAMCREGGEGCHRRLEEVNRALRGEADFTLIIEDPLGKSAVYRML